MNQAKTPKRLSCISCRQRKIKCDRVDPCAPCTRASIHCVFPQPAPPRVRTKFKAKSDQIAQRLSRLEGLVNALGGEDAVAAHTQAQGAGLPPQANAAGLSAQLPLPSGAESVTAASTNRDDDIVGPDGGKYLGNDFWSNLSSEVEGLRAILNDASLEDEDDEDELDSGTSPPVVDERESTPFSLPFGQSDVITDLIARYPSPAQMSKMLELYFRRYDGIFKVLHRPSILKNFEPIINDGKRFAPGSTDETLAFAIFYGAVTTLQEEECIPTFSMEKESLLMHYERSLETALHNAKLLTTTELGVLQAFCIYILCRRAHYTDRSAWSLISLAVRIAFAIDLNSDGESLDLLPFETEMRRRLWWSLVVLDIQGAEDRGMPQLIYSFQHDVEFPANINDEDIDPQEGFLHEKREGFTIMTFSMITFEISRTYEYISCAEPKNVQAGRGYRVPTLEEKERKVNEINNILHERYVKNINPDMILEKKASLIAQNAILKQWLLLQYPISSRGKAIMPRSLATKDQILSSAVSLLEIQYQIEHQGQVNWVSKVWIQWHPLAVVLAELCVRTSGPLVDRAWAIVDAVFDDWSEKVADTKNGALWRPIRKLMERARRVHRRPSPRKLASSTGSPEMSTVSRGSSVQPNHTPQPQLQLNVDGVVGSARGGAMTGVSPGPIAAAAAAPAMGTTGFASFDPSMPSMSDLHASTIAMALDPRTQGSIPSVDPYAGMSVPNMNPMAMNDPSMMAMNWEDWDTFFESNGIDVGYR